MNPTNDHPTGDDRARDELVAALQARLAAEPARPDPAVWAAIEAGAATASPKRMRARGATVDARRPVWLAAAAVLAVVAFAVGLAVGRDGTSSPGGQDVRVGGTALPPTASPPGVRFVAQYQALTRAAAALEQEGLASTAILADPSLVAPDALVPLRAATDRALDVWRTAVPTVDPTDPAEAELRDQLQRVDNRLRTLPTVRASVDQRQVDGMIAGEQYGNTARELVRTASLLSLREPSGPAWAATAPVVRLAELASLRYDSAVVYIEWAGPNPTAPLATRPTGKYRYQADTAADEVLGTSSIAARQLFRDRLADDAFLPVEIRLLESMVQAGPIVPAGEVVAASRDHLTHLDEVLEVWLGWLVTGVPPSPADSSPGTLPAGTVPPGTSTTRPAPAR